MKYILLLFTSLAANLAPAQNLKTLTPITGANVADADYVPLIDVSADGLKSLTLPELWKKLGGTNVSATELGYLDGVSSGIQNQLDKKSIKMARQLFVADYGARGDGVTLYDGVFTSGSTTFTSASASFSTGNPSANPPIPSDVGKSIVLQLSHSSRQVLTIASVTNSTTIVLSAEASETSSTYTVGITTYGTDNTAAIRAAITAASPAGGEIIFEGGVYLITGVPTDTSTINAVFKIPYAATSGGAAPAFTFRGVGAPQHTTFNPNQRPSVASTVLYCTNKTVTGSNAAIFAVVGMNFAPSIPSESYWGSVPTMTSFENMTIRQPAIPAMNALQFHLAGGLHVNNVRCDLDVPYHSTAFPWASPTGIVTAIIPPSRLSAYWSIIENTSITGYAQGVRITDSLRMDKVVFEACIEAMSQSVDANGSSPTNATNGMSAGQIFVNRCARPIYSNMIFDIQYLNIETNRTPGGDNVTPSWATNNTNETFYVLDNYNGNLNGTMNVLTILGGTGKVETTVRVHPTIESKLRIFDLFTQKTIGKNVAESLKIAAAATAPVSGPTLAIVDGSGGGANTATYAYRIGYVMPDQSILLGPESVITNAPTTLDANNRITFSAVPLVPQSHSYRVYRTQSTGTVSSLGLIGSDLGPATNGAIYFNSNLGDNGLAGDGNLPVNTAGKLTAERLKIILLPTHANNSAALAAGLLAGDCYKTSTGVIMVTY